MPDRTVPTNVIALVGVPGSGKTKLAKKLKDVLEETIVVDNYAEKVSQDADVALSLHATYFGNLSVALARVAAERTAVKAEAKNIVTCGTHMETIIYATLNGFATQPSDPQENMIHLERTQIFMRMLGLLTRDTFAYSHIFYLPVETEDEITKRLDAEVVVALGTFGVDYTTLSGTTDEQLATALVEINATPKEQRTPGS